MKRIRRSISFLLALVMVFSMVPPMEVRAEETEPTGETETVMTVEETAAPTEAVTEPTEETTLPTEVVTEPTGETTLPTETVTEPTEEIIVPTEEVTEPIEEVTTPAEEVLPTETVTGNAAANAMLGKTSGTCGENLTWALDDEGTLTVSGTGDMYDYAGDEPWNTIRESIKKVIIEDGVTYVGINAFQFCDNITFVEIPSSVKKIGNVAFYMCRSLTQLTIPEGVEVIGSGAFELCDNLSYVTIPDSVTTLESYAFAGTSSLNEVIIPSNVTYLGEAALCSEYKERIVFTGSAPEFDENAFLYMEATVYYPADNETWTEGVLQDYGGNLTWIPRISSMTQDEFEAAMETADEAREDYYLNTSVTLERDFNTGTYRSSVLYIPEDGCLIVPDGVTLTLGEYVVIDGGTLIVENGGSLVIEEYSNLYLNAGTLNVADGAELICQPGQIELQGNSADTNVNRELISVVVSCNAETLDEVISNAADYYGMVINLTSGFYVYQDFTIPENTVLKLNEDDYDYVGDMFFTIPSGRTLVNNGHLMLCYGGVLDVEDGAKVINNKYLELWSDDSQFVVQNGGSFENNGVLNAKSGSYINNGTEENHGSILRAESGSGICGENLTWEYNGTTDVLHISGNGDMYDYSYAYDENAAPWTAYYDVYTIEIDEGVTSIGDHAFEEFSDAQITLPEGLLSIGKDALPSYLTTLHLPASLTSLEDNWLFSLEEITVAEGSISFAVADDVLFSKDMTKLVKMPSQLADNGDYFEYIVPKTVKEICDGAFERCDFIDALVLPDGLEVIGNRAVSCYGTGVPYGPETIIIPSSVKSIGSEAFIGVRLVVFTGNAPAIADDAFSSCTKLAYYPSNNATWTSDKRQNYGGDLEWISTNGGVPVSGTMTESINWDFDEVTGTLTISGTGIMPGYSYIYLHSDFIPPWHHLANKIKTLVIEDGITEIGYGLFKNYHVLENVNLASTVRVIGDYAFGGCDALKTVDLGKGVTNIGLGAFVDCGVLTNIVIPETIDSIGEMAFCACASLTDISFTGKAPVIGQDAFCNVTATAHYPADNTTWTEEVMQDYGGTLTWVPDGVVENRVVVPSADLSGQTAVWIDGVEYAVQADGDRAYVDLPDSNAKTMIAYTYHVGDESDVHTQYPVSMKVWTLSNEEGLYTATRAEELDDILQYSGSSIRVIGKQGIRMITSIDKAKKTALTSDGLAGYTLKEYGTVVAWTNQMGNKPLVLGKVYAKSNYAYKKDVADPVFGNNGDLMQYTNVLVGFSNAQCKNDLAMRPYMILEDAEGNEITLYGGIVTRSIGYIALQNKDTFAEGTEAYDYVWDIIHSVYGDAYDEMNAA